MWAHGSGCGCGESTGMFPRGSCPLNGAGPAGYIPARGSGLKGGVEQFRLAYVQVMRFELKWMKAPDFAKAFGEPDA